MDRVESIVAGIQVAVGVAFLAVCIHDRHKADVKEKQEDDVKSFKAKAMNYAEVVKQQCRGQSVTETNEKLAGALNLVMFEMEERLEGNPGRAPLANKLKEIFKV